MQQIRQSPSHPAFVQNPYPFYAARRAQGDLFWWDDYKMPAAVSHRAVHSLLRDRRLGRAPIVARTVPEHLRRWDAIERHSMLDAEPPRHTRLRALVLRAFTSRVVNATIPEIRALCHDLIDRFPPGPFDVLSQYCEQIPVIIIARLLGVPEQMAPDLLRWSHAMVAMYQANRDRSVEEAADAAASDFGAFLSDYVKSRRQAPSDDLLSHLIAAEEAGDTLTTPELIGTCVLLLNAGHEATVHGLGNGIKAMLEASVQPACVPPEAFAEEVLRFDPPLHIFTRIAYEDAEFFGHTLRRGDEIALVLGAAGRDPAVWPDPDHFDPARTPARHHAFGGGLHFCLGAPLARLEMQIGLQILFERCPTLTLAHPPVFADTYHFHGLTELRVVR